MCQGHARDQMISLQIRVPLKEARSIAQSKYCSVSVGILKKIEGSERVIDDMI
ncbi:predicted protein [Botrytis cinerea T4]|uniref:Uncharacterized protein n=1 Tax=Botryotinia fuckeliana (strain T4) TaxID=999810 RepID=G2Y8B0_BOTF4|nr:predicted protein [Botrytis cinerea T4]